MRKNKNPLERIEMGKVYETTENYDCSWVWKGIYKRAFLPKGTKMKYVGKSLGNAHFNLLQKIPSWKDGKDNLVIIPGRVALKILKQCDAK